MESRSKLRLDRKTLEKIAAAAFGPECRLLDVRENRDGWFNALYSMEISGRGPVFLKAAPPRDVPVLDYEREIITTEIALLREWEKNAALPSPRVLFADGTRRIIESDYFIMEQLEGISLSKLRERADGDILARLDREKGRINREINSYRGDSFGLYGGDRKKWPTWREAFLDLADRILEDARRFDAAFPVSLEAIAALFRERSPCLESVTEPRLLHWDLHDGNILATEDGAITGIIDCDRALWGDPAMESYFTRLFPPGEEFLRGYGREVVDAPGFAERRELYDLYLTVIFVTECQSRNVTDGNHRKWAQDMFRNQWDWVNSRITGRNTSP